MSATSSNDNRNVGAVHTLGELLYADPDQDRVSERDWVALVASIAAGDQAALRAVYERMHRLVFTLTMRITGNRQAAEEVMLDVFHDVWRRASSYDPQGGTVIGWVMNQARSRALDRVRYENRRKRVPPVASQLSDMSVADSETAAEVQDANRLLNAAFAVLTSEERQAIETAFFSELTYAETAVRLSQPLGTIKTRIRSGLEKLRRALQAGVET